MVSINPEFNNSEIRTQDGDTANKITKAENPSIFDINGDGTVTV